MKSNPNMAVSQMAPVDGILKFLPAAAVPYAQLMRLQSAIGWWLLLLPCWFGSLLAVIASGQTALAAAPAMAVFWIGAVVMRGAGCVHNDILDRHFDVAVERTKSRPIPSGRVSVRKALMFMALLLLIGLCVLLWFDRFAIMVTLSSLLLAGVYPLVKRISHWPQFVLGLAFNWGLFTAMAALYGDLPWFVFVLYAGCLAWTIGYDTIYAHQDRDDDIQIGVRSTALLFGAKSRLYVGVCYGLMMLAFAISILAALAQVEAIVMAYVIAGITWALGALHLARQILNVDFDHGDSCNRAFKSNRDFGLIMCFGLILVSFLTGLN